MKQANWLLFFLLIVLGVPFFIHLDRLPIRLWDEARLALNAYEMAQNGNLLVTHFEGQPDMWNTKPPLLIWVQAAFISLFGFNEWAIRLPVAIAGFLICILLLWFSKACFGHYWLGLLASFVLITTDGFIHIHGSRTGDYDVPLTLFTTAYCLFFFLFLNQRKIPYLYFFFLFLTLAVFTKSIQGLLFLPFLFMYSIYRKQLATLLYQRHFYLGSLVFIMAISSYYLGRENINPGYLHAVWENELGGRYFSSLEENQQSNGYYVQMLTGFHFAYWSWFLPLGFLFLYKSRNTLYQHVYWYCLWLATAYLLIISFAGTKLEWYDIPLFPWLSLMVALSLYQVYDLLLRQKVAYQKWAVIGLILIMAYPYQHILRKTYRPSEYPWEKDLYPISYLLKHAADAQTSLQDYAICYTDYDQHLKFYIRKLQDAGNQIRLSSIDSLRPGEKVIAMEPEVLAKIEAEYAYHILEEHPQVKVYQLLEYK